MRRSSPVALIVILSNLSMVRKGHALPSTARALSLQICAPRPLGPKHCPAWRLFQALPCSAFLRCCHPSRPSRRRGPRQTHLAHVRPHRFARDCRRVNSTFSGSQYWVAGCDEKQHQNEQQHQQCGLHHAISRSDTAPISLRLGHGVSLRHPTSLLPEPH